MFYRQLLILFLSKLTELCSAKYEARHTAMPYIDTNGSDLSLQFGHGEKKPAFRIAVVADSFADMMKTVAVDA